MFLQLSVPTPSQHTLRNFFPDPPPPPLLTEERKNTLHYLNYISVVTMVILCYRIVPNAPLLTLY